MSPGQTSLIFLLTDNNIFSHDYTCPELLEPHFHFELYFSGFEFMVCQHSNVSMAK